MTNQALAVCYFERRHNDRCQLSNSFGSENLKVNADVANVAHLVRASGCGSEGSGFNSHHSPQIKKKTFWSPF
jgi:hypothetical protein